MMEDRQQVILLETSDHAEAVAAFRERRDHESLQTLLHFVPVGHRAPAVSRDIEHEYHAERPPRRPSLTPARITGPDCISSPRTYHLFPTLPRHSLMPISSGWLAQNPLSAHEIWQNNGCAILAIPSGRFCRARTGTEGSYDPC